MSMANRNDYDILRDALLFSNLKVAKEMVNCGASINNPTGDFGNTPLHHVSRLVSTEIAELLLSKVTNVNAANKWGETPLHKAVRERNIVVIKLLLRHNADVNAVTRWERTPLHYAARFRCSASIVELLLSEGSNINAANRLDGTPLHLAIKCNSEEVLRSLLCHGADINVADRFGKTPLHVAILFKRVEFIELLLHHDADVNAVINTPLQYATGTENGTKMFELLLSKKAVNAANSWLFTLLLEAIQRKNTDGFKLLLSRCSNINATGEYSNTLLHCATLKGCTQIVELLLTSQKVDVNAANRWGETPLHVAVQKGNIDIVRLLICHNADVNAVNRDERTPLHYTVLRGSESDRTGKIAELLLSSGADVNAKACGKTTLVDAINRRCDKVLEVLVRFKADVNAWDGDMKTPLMLSYNADITLLLLNNGAKLNERSKLDGGTALHYALICGKEHIVEVLLSRSDIEVNSKMAKGRTPLHIAVNTGQVTMAKVLVEKGADVNLKDDSGRSAIHYAASNYRHKNQFGFLLLLTQGADLNSVDAENKTPLQLAIERGDEDCFVSALLNRGAEPNVKDDTGKTPLHHAALKHSYNIVLSLLSHGANINVEDDTGKTPLHYAVKKVRFDVPWHLIYLVDHGAKVNLKDVEGKTPLHIVAGRQAVMTERSTVFWYPGDGYSKKARSVELEEGYSFETSVLLEHGADIDCKDSAGRTALYIASEIGNSQVARALLKYGADVNIVADPFSKHTPFQCVKTKNGNRFKDVKDILQNHIVMLRTLNFPVHKMNFESVDWNSLSVQKFQMECENELARSKEVYLENGEESLCFYAIITKNVKGWSRFLKSGMSTNLSDVFELQLRKFHIFHDMIALHFNRAVERELLLQEITLYFGQLFCLPPGICVEAITDYLNNEDLKVFITACRLTDE